ncbi:MAG: lysozyme family protein, partial [Lachnospiraceae bacterium]|nr:lysozyme family protein [Lachnospiraceae bacterium]
MQSNIIRWVFFQLKNEENRKRLILVAAIPAVIFLLLIVIVSGTSTTSGTASAALDAKVEEWRPMVSKYCTKYGIGEYTDLALALIQVESSGNEPDPMKAGEGAYGMYCLKTKNNNGGHRQVING